MTVWTVILLCAFAAIVGAIIIERTTPKPNVNRSCSCVSWGSPAHPSGVRVIRDANCPTHKEG